MKFPKTITIVGTGNVGYQMALACSKTDLKIESIYGRNTEKAKKIAKLMGAKSAETLAEIKSDFIIIAVKDDAIDNALDGHYFEKSILLHTSGSYQTDGLAKFGNNFGCFYPLQTLKEDVLADFENIPLLIEGNTTSNQDKILEFAKKMSNHVEILNSSQRLGLHAAAIFVNNFTNYMLGSTKNFCNTGNIPFRLLYPLLDQTIKGVKEATDPLMLQTGPAIRGDQETLAKHINLLAANTDLLDIYNFMTNNIIKGKTDRITSNIERSEILYKS